MQFYIVSVAGGSFTSDDGDKINYGSVMVLDSEIQNREGFAGQDVRKMKANPDLIHHIKNEVPAMFECQIEVVGKDSRIKIVGAKKVK